MAKTPEQRQAVEQFKSEVASDLGKQVLGAIEGMEPEPESPPPEQDARPDSSPEGEEPISYKKKTAERFDHVLSENKELKARLKELEKRSAADEKAVEVAKKYEQEALIDNVLNAKKPKGFDDWSADRKQIWFTNQLLEARGNESPREPVEVPADILAEREVFQVTGTREWTQRQIEALVDVREGAPGLNGEELVVLAAKRYPEHFQQPPGEDPLKGVPRSHFVNEPRSNRKNKAPKTRAEQADDAFDRAIASGNHTTARIGGRNALVAAIQDRIYKK